MKKRTLLQEYLFLYGDSTCLSLINLNYQLQFFASMETARSKLSAKYCETLIKKGITRLKKLNLSNRIMDAKRHGTNLIYRDLNSAIEELGECLVLDMLNHNLRYRLEHDIPFFKLTQTIEDDLEKAKSNWIEIKKNRSFDKLIEKECKEKGISVKDISKTFVPMPKLTRKLGQSNEEDKKWQDECRRKQQEKENAEREKEWERRENEEISNQSKPYPTNSVKRSLDADPDDDLSPEIFELNSLDVRKLKNVEVKHEKED